MLRKIGEMAPWEKQWRKYEYMAERMLGMSYTSGWEVSEEGLSSPRVGPLRKGLPVFPGGQWFTVVERHPECARESSAGKAARKTSRPRCCGLQCPAGAEHWHGGGCVHAGLLSWHVSHELRTYRVSPLSLFTELMSASWQTKNIQNVKVCSYRTGRNMSICR